MLTSGEQAERARAVIGYLTDRVARGEASDIDRQRIRAGSEELLCWAWEREGRRGHPRTDPAAPPDGPPRDPRAIRFVDWWERNAPTFDPHLVYWPDGFNWFAQRAGLGAAEALAVFEDAAAEIYERRWMRQEPVGMVVADLDAA